MSTKATAARIYEYGEPDFFRFETMDVPDPVGHEVLVRKAVYDSVGKDTFRGSLAVLRPRGTLVQFGNASGFPEPINPFELAPRALYLTWAILPHYNNTPEALAASSADLFDAIQSGILKVDPTNIYPFDQLVHAHQQLEQRRTVGATVLHV